jgi:hypothetical protein
MSNESEHNNSSAATEGYAAPDDWKQRLRPFAEIYAAAEAEMENLLKELDEEELRAILASAHKPTSTNCWWAAFKISRRLREMAHYRLRCLQAEKDESAA